MARIREIKPEFFLDEEIAALSPLARLAFIGLWQLADREGRLEDKPNRLRAQIFPYDQGTDMTVILDELARSPGRFVVRYQVDARAYLEIRSFRRHQRPHPKEKPSELPAPPGQGETSTSREISRLAVESPDEPRNSGSSRSGSSGISGSSGPSGAFGTRAQSDARAGDPAAAAATPGPVALAQAVAVAVEQAGELVLVRAPTSYDVVQLYGQVRGDCLNVPGWNTPGGNSLAKAERFVASLRPESVAQLEPSMRLFFQHARDPTRSADQRLLETTFGFAAWLARFPDLCEELRGERRPPAAAMGPREAAFLRSVLGRNAC
jgi:hypothetical protein